MEDNCVENANEASETSGQHHSSGTARKYTILEQPSRVTRPIKVIAVGAGASALNFAHEVSTSDLDVELVCYEKNPSIGGTCT